jgi:membrane-anchored protein YejM (alkaline phosphatase superfamily)
MPNTWQFSQHALRFAQHYSSGNGTREGLFGMFYGLYGSYWENFMHARQSPLLMDRMQQLGYAFDIRTSASFTYPEFDKTLFVNVAPEVLHPADAGLAPWQRDEANTDALLRFLDTHDATKPSFWNPRMLPIRSRSSRH